MAGAGMMVNSAMLKLVRPEDLPHGKSKKKAKPADKLTLEEKRRMLTDIMQVNIMDYFNEDGSFDALKAQREIPGWCVQGLSVDEVTRTDRNGNETTTRKVRLRLVDRLKALEMDSDLADRKDGSADEPSPEEKAKRDQEFREAQERARQLIKEKLLGPNWPN